MRTITYLVDEYGLSVAVSYYENRQSFLRAIRKQQGKTAPKRNKRVYGMCVTYAPERGDPYPAQFGIFLNTGEQKLVTHEAQHAAMRALVLLKEAGRLSKNLDEEEFLCYLSTGMGDVITKWISDGCPKMTEEYVNSEDMCSRLGYASHAFDVRKRLDGHGGF